MSFSAIAIFLYLVGAAVYLSIVYFAGRRGWWWLALLVSLPAVFLSVSFTQMPRDYISKSSSLLFRHFDKVGIAQLVLGVVTYFFGRLRSRPDTSK